MAAGDFDPSFVDLVVEIGPYLVGPAGQDRAEDPGEPHVAVEGQCCFRGQKRRGRVGARRKYRVEDMADEK